LLGSFFHNKKVYKMSLKEKINSDFKGAMKSGDKVANTIRS